MGLSMFTGRAAGLLIAAIILFINAVSTLKAQSASTSVSWSSAGTGIYGTSPVIYTIAVNQNGIVYAGGSFTKLGDRTTEANRIARWDPASGIWTPLSGGGNNGVAGVVYSITLNGNDVYVAGLFTTLKNGTPASRIAKWNSETGSWSNLGGTTEGANGTIRCLTAYGNCIYAAGEFTSCGNSISALRIARWNTAAGTWDNLPCGDENGVDGAVLALAAAGDYIYAGGRFTHLSDGTPVNHIARYNLLTQTWSPLPGASFNGVNGDVSAIAVIGNEVYAGGDFDFLGDGITSAHKIAKWNSSTGSWSPLICGSSNGVNASVNSITWYGDDLYIAGTFTQLSDGTVANRIVKWNRTNSRWILISDAGSVGVNGSINALAVNPSEGKLYAGGVFTSVGSSISAPYIARLSDAENALPVELSSFSAEFRTEGVCLQWQTATETGNFGFDIERARRDESGNIVSDFMKIGFVRGHGNSYKPINYSFTDVSLNCSGRYIYRLKQIDIEGSFKYSKETEVTAAWSGFELYSSYPNPFNPLTHIDFRLDKAAFVTLKIYNSLGILVKTLVDELKPAGRYSSEFDASHLPSGIYYCELHTDNQMAVKKMLHLK